MADIKKSAGKEENSHILNNSEHTEKLYHVISAGIGPRPTVNCAHKAVIS